MAPGDKKFGPGIGQERDPFVTPRHRISTRLSPTASTFNPFTNVNSLGEASKSNPVATALSTELGLSRYLLIASDTHLEAEEVSIWLDDLDLHGRRFHGQRSIDTENGKVYVHFRDIRDACSTLATTLISRKSWKVEYCGSLGGHRQNPGSETESPALNTGQILLVATISPSISLDVGQVFDIAQNFLHSYGRLFAFIKIPNPSKTPSFRAIAEFCDISHATKVIANCAHVTTPEGVHLVISAYETNSTFVSPLKPTQNVTGANTQNNAQHQHMHIGSASRSVVPIEARVSHPFTMYPLMVQSPFVANVPYILDSLPPGSSQGSVSPITTLAPSFPVLGPLYHAPPSPALTVQSNYSPSRAVAGFFRSDGRRQNAARVTRSPYNNSTNHHNYVDINRIRDGIDVRTTIMLRNIPNKVDQAMLKRIIDESSWGKYDFMYLRIDFANDCNVGYAFINFVDPLDIIDFVEARGNQRWNCFKSDKIAEISYATIQGKDCLVQKFRNSSVMLEAPHYRPKLYFTCNGPCPELAGQEEPFPDPDNQSKMKRSCENAEHVGLFTPNAGQHYRDEQRRRRSQYDRGTRLAALEEYDYEAAIQNMYTITPH
ncbi:meiosis protein MEI2 [Metarhizium brunneum]